MPDPVKVRSMFARIAPRYDLLNRVLSLGIDRSWRGALLAHIGAVRGLRAVDVCCGTGDVALLLARGGAEVVGVDFTREMLLRACQRGSRASGLAAGPGPAVAFVHGDAMALPLRSSAADLVTVAFGLRNVADRDAALREMARVLRPGGRLLVLEFGTPENRRLAAGYGLYFRRVLPVVGGLVSGDREAYRYLPESVSTWPGPAELQRELAVAGFGACGHRSLSGGIAFLHWGTAPLARP